MTAISWWSIMLVSGVGFLAGSLRGEVALTPDGRLTLSGDLRARYELDYDSRRADGTMRDDRHRGRVRARFGLGYRIDSDWRVGLRLRTGDHRSQQSPHLTVRTDDGESGELEFVLDKYFLAFEEGALRGWVGRNSFPFWKHNELFWDDDVTPTGMALSVDAAGDQATLTAGAFLLPDGGHRLHQPMVGGQVKLKRTLNDVEATVAPGFYYLSGRDEPADYLLSGNGQRDYAIAALNSQVATTIAGLPLTFGCDLYKNFEQYRVGETGVTRANREDDFGYVLSARLGSLKEQGDWLLAYYYAHLGVFAVNGSYAQDDWLRWGNGPQTRSSDFEGHELRAAVAVSENLNLVARWYWVESISTREDGDRFRLDVNFRF